MEPHPPLGKLLIALGENVLNANDVDDQFISTDHAQTTPPGFSFRGYRFFPALFGWLTAPLFFLLLLKLTGQHWTALGVSLLYVFDNALIVHSRGAMLESVQIFFIVATLLSALSIPCSRASTWRVAAWSIVCGVSFGAVIATKLNGLILILGAPLLAARLWRHPSQALRACTYGALSTVLTNVAVWHIHFSLGSTINQRLPDSGYYQASEQYKQILARGDNRSLLNFPRMMADSVNFVGHYQKGVPRLNLCSPSENGSPPWGWPFGARAINYRWKKSGDKTEYLYLQSNPVAWGASLLGVIGAFAMMLGAVLLPLRRRVRRRGAIGTLLVMYAGYMLTMLQLERVMYLYHYFIPLLLGYILFALVASESTRRKSIRLWRDVRVALVACIAAAAAVTYGFFSPLTYAVGITDRELAYRSWLAIWDLRCVDCKLTNSYAKPVCDPKIKQFPNISISGLRAEIAKQDWGEPRQNAAMEADGIVVGGMHVAHGIGTHANSSIRFRVNRKYSEFSGLVGLPDYLEARAPKSGSVRFEIRGDGRTLWRSERMTAGTPSSRFTVTIADVAALELVTEDSGDGIDNDHAVWGELVLKE